MIPFKSNFWNYLFDATFDNRHGEVCDVVKLMKKSKNTFSNFIRCV